MLWQILFYQVITIRKSYGEKLWYFTNYVKDHVFNLKVNSKVSQNNVKQCNDDREDAHVCSMSSLANLGRYILSIIHMHEVMACYMPLLIQYLIGVGSVYI